MKTEEIFYTDGQDIVVTLTTLRVKDRLYNLKSIRKHGLAILQPARLPGIFLFLLGIGLVAFGMVDALPPATTEFLKGRFTDLNTLSQWTGALLTTGGLAIIVARHERYAVRIDTGEGETDAVVSLRREHVAEIVDALSRVYMFNDSQRSVARAHF